MLAKTQLEAVGFDVTRSIRRSADLRELLHVHREPGQLRPGDARPSPRPTPTRRRILRRSSTAGARRTSRSTATPASTSASTRLPAIPGESARLSEYASLDAQLADSAAAIAIGYNRRRDAFADRIGCRVVNQALVGYAVNRFCIAFSAHDRRAVRTVSTGADATPAAPLQTRSRAPAVRAGRHHPGAEPADRPPEYRLLEQRLDISASPDADAAELRMTSRSSRTQSLLDASRERGRPRLPERRAGPDCTGPGATPDPCVAFYTTRRTARRARRPYLRGQRVEVRERDHASDGLPAPVKNAPLVTDAKAGATLPWRSGSVATRNSDPRGRQPARRLPARASRRPVPAHRPSRRAGSQSRRRDADLQAPGKTARAWAGTCRVLTIRFREGSTLTALVRFK